MKYALNKGKICLTVVNSSLFTNTAGVMDETGDGLPMLSSYVKECIPAMFQKLDQSNLLVS